MQPSQSSRRILKPVRSWFIVLTLFVALLLNLIPLGSFPGVPDWVALTLIFWCMHQPQRIGMGAAFMFGLAMDVLDSSIMGQHALAYVALAYVAAGISRRVLWFPLWQQALHVMALMLATQGVMLLARLLTGAQYPGMLWFLSSVTAALLWNPVTHLLLTPQFRPEDKDFNRPI